MSFITDLFNHYGYIVLFVALAVELIGLPALGETLMTYCGFLSFQGKLNWALSIFIASSGAIFGITAAYLIGSFLGKSFFVKIGPYIHMGPGNLEKTSDWFKKYGKGLLWAAYFIPGIIHIVGYFSGITKIPYKKFALNAYIGAFLWTGTFITLGKVLGSNWERFHGSIKRYLIIGGIIVSMVLTIVYLYKSRKQRIKEFLVITLKKSLKIFHSLGRIRIAVLMLAVAFIVLSILVVGLIQDYFADEFIQFDSIAAFLIGLIFTSDWSFIMKCFSYLTSYYMLALIAILMSLWIMIKRNDRFLEIGFLTVTILGGGTLAGILRYAFHRIGPSDLFVSSHAQYTFPSENSLMAVVSYGFTAFIILRHTKTKWIRAVTTILYLLICICSGLSPLFFELQYPSDVIAGYVFGGVWLSLNIILLEIFRVMQRIKLNQEM